jgi:hypothetical protein
LSETTTTLRGAEGTLTVAPSAVLNHISMTKATKNATTEMR